MFPRALPWAGVGSPRWGYGRKAQSVLRAAGPAAKSGYGVLPRAMPKMKDRYGAFILIDCIIDEVRRRWHLSYAGSMVILRVPKRKTLQTGRLFQKFFAQFSGGIGIVPGDKRRDVGEFV